MPSTVISPKRVEAAEVDQDDVDDVGAAALRVARCSRKKGEMPSGVRAGHDRVGDAGQAEARRGGQQQVAQAAQSGGRGCALILA